MRGFGEKFFARFPPVELVRDDGSRIVGKGIVTRQKAAGGSLGLTRHLLGELTQPVYVFTGWLEGADRGDLLCQGGAGYRVVSAQAVELAGKKLWLRAILEKREEENEGV